MTKTNKVPLEKEIQKATLKRLWDLKVFCWRNNTGMIPAMYRGVPRVVQFGAKGSPDIIAIVYGYFVGIEMKRPGGKQTESQKAFQQNIEDAGGYYILAFSPDEVEDKIKKIQHVTSTRISTSPRGATATKNRLQ